MSGGGEVGGGGGGSSIDETPIKLAGGFTDPQKLLSVESIASKFCLGSIQRELPSELLGMPLADVLKRADAGDRAAIKCKKLLGQDRFRK